MAGTLDLEEYSPADSVPAPVAIPLRKKVSALDLDVSKSRTEELPAVTEEEAPDLSARNGASIDIEHRSELRHPGLMDDDLDSSSSPSGIWNKIKQYSNAESKSKVPAGIKPEAFEMIQELANELVVSLNKEMKRMRRLYMTDAITGKKFDVMFECKQEGKVWHIQSRHKSLLNNKIFPLISLFYKPSSTKPKLIWRGLHTQGLREVEVNEIKLKEACSTYLDRCVKMRAEQFNVHGKHIPKSR